MRDKEESMDHPRPNLRYVDAKDLDDTAMKLRGLGVESIKNENLGKVEGFIIDVTTGRPYHVVVGSGGWFRHKHFLLPIGHVALSPAADKIVADVPKDRVQGFPGFDKDEFKKMSEEDLGKLEAPTSAACCPDEATAVEVVAWETTHYAYPTWWEAGYYRPDRAETSLRDTAGAHLSTGSPSSGPTAGPPRQGSRERDRVVASARDEAPIDDGVRAQPGDVLGLDTDGERTSIGDTSEDEDRRRRDAEKAARKP
jgi:hypothetical protein